MYDNMPKDKIQYHGDMMIKALLVIASHIKAQDEVPAQCLRDAADFIERILELNSELLEALEGLFEVDKLTHAPPQYSQAQMDALLKANKLIEKLRETPEDSSNSI